MEPTKVRDVMTREVVTVESGTSIRDAAREMESHDISSIVVVRDGKPTGIVTERDLVRKVMLAGLPLEKEIDEVMSTPLITVEPGTELSEVSRIMAEANIRRLPVKEGEELVGIVTATDVFEFSPRCESEFVKSISRLEDLLGRL
ncbi:MAG: CBS domain-containing protein [Euryarchaeota archaeon]|nr:CBS domain-containing protein [Euryarchaeota archaeon]